MIKKIWMSPNNLVGILFQRIVGGPKDWNEKADKEFVAVKGSKANFIMRQKLSIRAITLGEYRYYAFGCWDAPTRAHEQEHIDQAQKFGPFWFPAYGVMSLISKIIKNNWYWNNEFEEEARKEEERVRAERQAEKDAKNEVAKENSPSSTENT